MGARTYVLLDIADGKSEQAGQGRADVISVKIAHAYAQQSMTDQWGGTLRVREEQHLAYLRTSGQLLIPLRLDKNAAIQRGERPLVLIDESLFGGAKIGILLTDQRIYAHEMWKPPRSWPLEEIQEVRLERGKNFFINGVKFWKRNSWGKKAACEEFSKLLNEILKVATRLGK